MPNVFEGALDARQSQETAMPVSRFRPRYRAITFTGVWPAIDTLKNFKPWNNK